MITKLWFVQESSTFGLSSGETSETVPSVSMRIVLLLLLCTATVVPAEACTKDDIATSVERRVLVPLHLE